MFRVKIMHQPDRSRQEAIKARIKDRQKAEQGRVDIDNYAVKQAYTEEGSNAKS